MLIPFDFERTLRAIRETLHDLATAREADPAGSPEALAALSGLVDARGVGPWEDALRLPAALQPKPLTPAMSPDEVVAYDLLERHLFSRGRLAEDGLLEDYRALAVPEGIESRWRIEYVSALIDCCGAYPECAGTVLALAREFALPDVADRLVLALDDAATTYAAPDRALLDACVVVADELNAGGIPGDAAALRDQLAELGRRLYLRLSAYEPEGIWRDALEKLCQSLGLKELIPENIRQFIDEATGKP